MENGVFVWRGWRVVTVLLASFLVAGSAEAGMLKFKMTADKTELALGETATVSIWGWADDALATGVNGLNVWQLDMVPDQSGVVSVTGVTILQPNPRESGLGYFSINSPAEGTVGGLGAVSLNNPQDSTVGVGGYTELARVELEMLVETGAVTYELSNSYGILRDGTYFGAGEFDVAGSDVTFTSIPEPASLSMALGAMGLLCRHWRRRRAC